MRYRLYPSKDNTIIEGTHFNSGKNQVAELWYGKSGIARHLMYFDIQKWTNRIQSGISPANFSDVNCKLNLSNCYPILESKYADNEDQAKSSNIEVRKLTKFWDEGDGFNITNSRNGTIGYSNWYSATSYQAWGVPGGDFSDDIIFTQHIDIGNENINGDVTSLVEDWVNSASTNHGILIKYSTFHELQSVGQIYLTGIESGIDETVTMTAYWTVPIEGADVVRYILQLSTNGGSWNTLSDQIVDVEYTFTGSSLNTYRVRVAGIDSFDRQGEWSEESNTFTPGVTITSSNIFPKTIYKFHNRETNTYFNPYIQFDWDGQIKDGRSEVKSNSTNRLYLYVNKNGKFTNPYDIDNVTVAFSNSGITSLSYSGSEIVNQYPGIYYVEFTCPEITGSNITFTDTWNIKYDSTDDYTSIVQSGNTNNNSWSNDSSFDLKTYKLSIPKLKNSYGKDEFSILKINAIREYTNINEVLKDLEYRIDLVDGNNLYEMLDWDKVSYTNDSNVIFLDTSWFHVNNLYKITFKVDNFDAKILEQDLIRYFWVR